MPHRSRRMENISAKSVLQPCKNCEHFPMQYATATAVKNGHGQTQKTGRISYGQTLKSGHVQKTQNALKLRHNKQPGFDKDHILLHARDYLLDLYNTKA